MASSNTFKSKIEFLQQKIKETNKLREEQNKLVNALIDTKPVDKIKMEECKQRKKEIVRILADYENELKELIHLRYENYQKLKEDDSIMKYYAELQKKYDSDSGQFYKQKKVVIGSLYALQNQLDLEKCYSKRTDLIENMEQTELELYEISNAIKSNVLLTSCIWEKEKTRGHELFTMVENLPV